MYPQCFIILITLATILLIALTLTLVYWLWKRLGENSPATVGLGAGSPGSPRRSVVVTTLPFTDGADDSPGLELATRTAPHTSALVLCHHGGSNSDFHGAQPPIESHNPPAQSDAMVSDGVKRLSTSSSVANAAATIASDWSKPMPPDSSAYDLQKASARPEPRAWSCEANHYDDWISENSTRSGSGRMPIEDPPLPNPQALSGLSATSPYLYRPSRSGNPALRVPPSIKIWYFPSDENIPGSTDGGEQSERSPPSAVQHVQHDEDSF